MKRGKALTEEQLLGVIEEYGFQATLAKDVVIVGGGQAVWRPVCIWLNWATK